LSQFIFLKPLFLRGAGEVGTLNLPNRLFRPSVALMHAAAAKPRPGKITPKMEKLRKKFQADNDLPVFLKGGSMDKLLYRLTWVLCFIGMAGDVLLWFGYILA
ncbi:hypothetical protein KR067_002344, partial [Drosophila pandora]